MQRTKFLRMVCAVIALAASLTLATGARAEGRYKVLHHFTGGKDGGAALSRLLFDSAGRLYGVTSAGGSQTGILCTGQVAYGCGVVFEIAPAGSEWRYKVIHTFCLLPNCADGAFPSGGLISDSAGNLYGVAGAGGNPPACRGYGCGVIYQLSPSPQGQWKYRVIFTFPGGSEGAFPLGPLTLDSAGNLYGDAVNGGMVGGTCAFEVGCGLVFQLTPNPRGTRWTEKVLHTFTGGADGALPQGGLVLDGLGNLYGTTEAGGIANPGWCVLVTCGVVFQLTPNSGGAWQQTIIHSFTGASDGGTSTASLILDAIGNLYGTSSEGGWGDVFKFSPAPGGGWTETVIGSPGGTTYGPVLLDSAGNLYGTTANGGPNSAGFIFEFRPNGDGTWTETVLYEFCSRPSCADGGSSYAGLVSDLAGNLYGVTDVGGNGHEGTVFVLQRK